MAWSRVVVANGFIVEIREFKGPRHISCVADHFVIDQIAQADERSGNGNWRSNAV